MLAAASIKKVVGLYSKLMRKEGKDLQTLCSL